MKVCRCFSQPCVCCATCYGRGLVLVAAEALLDDDGVHVLVMGYQPRRCHSCAGTGERT